MHAALRGVQVLRSAREVDPARNEADSVDAKVKDAWPVARACCPCRTGLRRGCLPLSAPVVVVVGFSILALMITCRLDRVHREDAASELARAVISRVQHFAWLIELSLAGTVGQTASLALSMASATNSSAVVFRGREEFVEMYRVVLGALNELTRLHPSIEMATLTARMRPEDIPDAQAWLEELSGVPAGTYRLSMVPSLHIRIPPPPADHHWPVVCQGLQPPRAPPLRMLDMSGVEWGAPMINETLHSGVTAASQPQPVFGTENGAVNQQLLSRSVSFCSSTGLPDASCGPQAFHDPDKVLGTVMVMLDTNKLLAASVGSVDAGGHRVPARMWSEAAGVLVGVWDWPAGEEPDSLVREVSVVPEFSGRTWRVEVSICDNGTTVAVTVAGWLVLGGGLLSSVLLLGLLVRHVAGLAALGDRMLKVQRDSILRQAELRQNALVEFLRSTSHDMRTPLHTMTMAVGELEEMLCARRAAVAGCGAGAGAPRLCEGADDVLHVMQRSSAMLGLIVDNVLDVSRIERGELEPTMRRAQLTPVLQDVAATVRPLFESTPVAFEFEAPPVPLPPCLCDAPRVARCLLNALSNARKFTTAGRVRVLLRVYEDPREASHVALEAGREWCDAHAVLAAQAGQPGSVRSEGGGAARAALSSSVGSAGAVPSHPPATSSVSPSGPPSMALHAADGADAKRRASSSLSDATGSLRAEQTWRHPNLLLGSTGLEVAAGAATVAQGWGDAYKVPRSAADAPWRRRWSRRTGPAPQCESDHSCARATPLADTATATDTAAVTELAAVAARAAAEEPSGSTRGGRALVACGAPLVLLVAVSDTGRGMTWHQVHSCVRPFFKTSEDNQEGTGLGLNVVLASVLAHSGELTIVSHPRVGTTVAMLFLLPRPAGEDAGGRTAVTGGDIVALTRGGARSGSPHGRSRALGPGSSSGERAPPGVRRLRGSVGSVGSNSLPLPRTKGSVGASSADPAQLRRPGGHLSPLWRHHGPVCVLVVDDETVNARLLQRLVQRMVEPATTEVVMAHNGQEAIDRVRERLGGEARVALIIMDMNMPILNGLEATAAIRSMYDAAAASGGAGVMHAGAAETGASWGSDAPAHHDGPPQPWIVMLTGNVTVDDQRAAMQVGADAFESKPCTPSIIAEHVGRAGLLRKAKLQVSVGALEGPPAARVGGPAAPLQVASVGRHAKEEGEECKEEAKDRHLEHSSPLCTACPAGSSAPSSHLEQTEQTSPQWAIIANGVCMGASVRTATDGSTGPSFAAAGSCLSSAVTTESEHEADVSLRTSGTDIMSDGIRRTQGMPALSQSGGLFLPPLSRMPVGATALLGEEARRTQVAPAPAPAPAPALMGLEGLSSLLLPTVSPVLATHAGVVGMAPGPDGTSDASSTGGE